MENRFGFKDFVSTVLVVLLICVVLLGMRQLDRQWVALERIERQGTEQTRLLASISRSLDEISSNGLTVTGPAGTQPTTQHTRRPDPFAAMKQAEARPDFARGDFLIDNLNTKLGGSITPNIKNDLYSSWIQAKVLETLAFQDPDTLEYVPLLARDWQMTPDAMKITFQLRKGVRFSDGEPMTADDVVYSWQFIMDPKINAPAQRSYFERVKAVRKINDYEVEFDMAEPYFQSFDLCAASLMIIPKHFYSKFEPEQINQNPGLVMGTGPYRFPDPQSWRPGQKIELVRNEVYWGEPATFDKLVFGEVEEEAATETMFRNGELDIYRTLPQQFDRMIRDPKVMEHANAFAIDSPMNGFYFLGWNELRGGKKTLFADARVRKALSLLTDRPGICKSVFLGYATPISGPFSAGSPQADPSIAPLPYDPAAAKELLAQVGFADRDGSGVIKGPDGQPFRFQLTYGSGNATTERVVLFMKDSFAKAGITMQPDPQQWSIVNDRMEHREVDAVFMGWAGVLETDLYQMFDSTQNVDQGDNFVSYNNPALDKAVREARRTIDDAKRMELWHKAHRILAEDQPYTFLFSRKTLRLIDKRVQNVRQSKVELNVVDRWAMPIPWYVPKAMQKYH